MVMEKKKLSLTNGTFTDDVCLLIEKRTKPKVEQIERRTFEEVIHCSQRKITISYNSL